LGNERSCSVQLFIFRCYSQRLNYKFGLPGLRLFYRTYLAAITIYVTIVLELVAFVHL
jgi:hypothetical protein